MHDFSMLSGAVPVGAALSTVGTGSIDPRPASAQPAGAVGACVVGVASASLGIYTRYAAVSAPAVVPDAPVADDAAVLSRLEQWELQSVARRLLPSSRLRVCCIVPAPRTDGGSSGVKVLHSSAHSSAHYGGLMRCGSVWACPVCSRKISAKRAVELGRVIDWWRVSMAGLVALCTYTIAHGRHDDLAALLAAVKRAYRSMTKSRRYVSLMASYGLSHTVRALEVTCGLLNGWHPHLHVLFLLSSVLDEAAVNALQAELFGLWSVELQRVGLSCSAERGVKLDVRDGAIGDYVSKYASKWSAADELARANTKRGRHNNYAPFDLLRQVLLTGESQFAEWFSEYARVFKGQRHLVYSKGLAAAAGLVVVSDDQLVELEEEDAVLLATLGEREWAAVRKCGARGQVLEVARSGDRAALVAFVAGLGVRCGM